MYSKKWWLRIPQIWQKTHTYSLKKHRKQDKLKEMHTKTSQSNL